MTKRDLLWRSLRHFWRANLAVAAGVVVATAVLTGALMVGDSVRGSLRDLALQRLGPVDQAMVAPGFFQASLAQRLAGEEGFASQFEACVPAIVLHGGASDESGSTRTAGVQIIGLDSGWLAVPRGQCVLNGTLADELGVQVGQTVLLNAPTAAPLPAEALLGRRSRTETLTLLRLTVARIERAAGFAAQFTLSGTQRAGRNAWVNLADLQQAIDQPGGANAILVTGRDNWRGPGGADELQRRLQSAATLADYGLRVERLADGAAALTSQNTYINPAAEAAADAVSRELGIAENKVLVYLVNAAERVGQPGRGTQTIHYAVAAGISDPPEGPLGEGEVALNEWAAGQLGAAVGDRVALAYYDRQSNGELAEIRTDRPGHGLTFRVARILPMAGLGADASLTPPYKGLTDRASIADWNPPAELAIRKDLVTPADEEYWKQYRAAPKLLLNLQTAQRLWGEAFGRLTSIRVPPEQAEAFAAAMERRLAPASMGLAFRPVRAEQLAASGGSTDFAGLFVGFSFFLILSAVLLVALLFRLGVEQRARQMGLLTALGFTPSAVRRLALTEGFIVALLGAGAGLAGAVGYTALMMAGLRTWWRGAVGTSAMHLHVEPMTLVVGLLASVAIALLAMAWGVWRVGKVSPAALLAGSWGAPAFSACGGRRVLLVAVVATLGGAGLLMLPALRMLEAQWAFLGGGAVLLVAAMCWLAWLVRPRGRRTAHLTGTGALARLGMRNAGRRLSRSVLTMGLLGFATFILVTVAAFRHGPPQNTADLASGAGGYTMMLQSDIPLLADPSTLAGRRLMGIRNAQADLWNRVRFTPLHRHAGQDTSCLNLTRVTAPTIVDVPSAEAWRGRFTFARQSQPAANPWALLETPLPGGDVPVIADDETARYLLHVDLGGTLTVTDSAGRPRVLRLVATLAGSVFQGELLIGRGNFRRLFPTDSGFGLVLIEAAPADEAEVRRTLSEELADYAVTVDATSQVLGQYLEVANTYLSTFQTLGALGLMLGTIGLAVVLLRNLIERRAELAVLSALGFSPAARMTLVMSENLFLLLLGLLAGLVCALIGVLPNLAGSARTINLASLAGTLGLVLAVGLAVLLLTMALAGRRVKVADLREE